MRYVCLIRSVWNPRQTCTGITHDLKRRLRDHNSAFPAHVEVPSLGVGCCRGIRGRAESSGV